MFEISVDIAAALDEVWTVLVDVEGWPSWTASVSKVKVLDGTPLAVGSRVRVRQPRLPATVWDVSSLEPGRSFTWTAAAPGVTTVADHRLEAQGDGVRATLALERSGPLAPVVDLLFRRLTRRYVTMEADGLKRRCEAAG